MGLLYMANVEHEQHVKYLAEAAKLLGQEALLYQVDKKDCDLYHDKDVVYKKPIKINFLLEHNPTPILKKLNWFSEDDELPYIGYLTKLDNDYKEVSIDKECLIETSTAQIYEKTSNKFIITSVRGSKLHPLFWICKLVPYREKTDKQPVKDPEAPQNTDFGYGYIQRKWE